MSARAPCQTSAGAISPPQQDHIDVTLPDRTVQHNARAHQPITLRCVCRQLLALHRTAVLRHDNYGQETLLNLLLRNYLQYSLYDQVSAIKYSGHLMPPQSFKSSKVQRQQPLPPCAGREAEEQGTEG